MTATLETPDAVPDDAVLRVTPISAGRTADAYLEAMDYGIVNGSGNGTMTGILNDARITNNVTMTSAQINDWKAWRKNFFANLPLGYRGGEFIFPVGTVDAYLETR